MSGLDADIVGERLGLSPRAIEWLRGLPPVSLPSSVLPDDDTARSQLSDLGVDRGASPEILATRPDPAETPELWWVFERACHDLLGSFGNRDGFAGWPCMPADGAVLTRHLYIWVFLAALPDVRRFHAGRGIPDDTSWSALRTLGGAINDSRTMFGTSGLLFDLWVQPLAFRGVHYPVGRLAYDLCDLAEAHSDGVDLHVHIPGGRPLLPRECDQSLKAALEFFTRHFPERPVRRFSCQSWLLDPQIAEYLPEHSNIVLFQRRFQLQPHDPDRDRRADNEILELVFELVHREADVPEALLAGLPQDTSLQRAFVRHLRAGRHWYWRTGWFPVTALGQ